MKKFLKVTLVIVALVVIAFFTLVLPKTVSMIEDYPRYTFEYVTEDTAMVSDYAIGANRNPGDYGYSGFEEVDYTSLLDDTQLNGWYVAATKDSITRTLVISHGRTANRLKTMKYLQVIKEFGLDSLYNVFIPDHRNSGKSQEAATAMGYYFSEDVGAVMKMLHDRYGQDNFVLWGFSMGAMASATAINRPEVQDMMAANGLTVEKLILASPLSNVQATLRVAADNMGIPGFISNMSYNKFSNRYDGYIDEMKFSSLLTKKPLPALVLHGDGDATTPSQILEAEIEGLSNVQAHLFKDAEHVQLYTQPQYRERYGTLVNDFLRQ